MNAPENYFAIAEFIANECKVNLTNPSSFKNKTTLGLQDFLNWENFYNIAKLHNFTAQVYLALKANFDIDSIPSTYISPFRKQYEINQKRNSSLREELLYLIRELRKHDVEILPYKEPLSFFLEYSDIATRQFKDIDFLIDPKDIEKIYKVFTTLGYTLEQPANLYRSPCYERTEKDYSFIKKTACTTGKSILDPFNPKMTKSGCVILEAHWSLTRNCLSIKLPTSELFGRSITNTYKDEPINLLSPEDSFVMSCIVGSKSEWRTLKLISDVAIAIEYYPDLNWEKCIDIAKNANSLRMFLLGSLLAKKIAKSKIPEKIYELAVSNKEILNISNDIYNRILDPSSTTRVNPKKFSLEMYKLREKRRDRIRYLFDTFTTPSQFDLNYLPLPSKLYFLYRFISPLTYYFIIPTGRTFRNLFRHTANM